MGPLNRYSSLAALGVIAVVVLLHPSALVVGGLVGLALAVLFLTWDPERDEMFSDDWTEIGCGALVLVCGLVGLLLLLLAGVGALLG